MSEDGSDFGTNVGEGVGCFLIFFGAAIFFNMPALIELGMKMYGK